MQIFTNPQDLAAQCRSWHAAGEDIALVPTMGYYHAGHEALMDQGRGLAKRLVVSLFVNPTQFGPNEDLSAYPRDIERAKEAVLAVRPYQKIYVTLTGCTISTHCGPGCIGCFVVTKP